MITGNEAENQRWNDFYDRISTRPPADATPPPEGMNAEQTTAWLYSAAGRSMQLLPPEPAPDPLTTRLQQFYGKPVSSRLSSQRAR